MRGYENLMKYPNEKVMKVPEANEIILMKK